MVVGHVSLQFLLGSQSAKAGRSVAATTPSDRSAILSVGVVEQRAFRKARRGTLRPNLIHTQRRGGLREPSIPHMHFSTRPPTTRWRGLRFILLKYLKLFAGNRRATFPVRDLVLTTRSVDFMGRGTSERGKCGSERSAHGL